MSALINYYLRIIDGTPVLPSSYSARVEMNWQEAQSSKEMDMSYNNALNKAFIEFKENNQVNRLIFNFDTDEIFSIKCKLAFLNMQLYKSILYFINNACIC